uniref:Uncharacterized protein n=1 Tax=Vespula pensylvanica TaxID=30213 RepID=A0A834UBR9_VESPE|nr:hypothetical protein H0235_005546 [Vespula pensylvanica]
MQESRGEGEGGAGGGGGGEGGGGGGGGGERGKESQGNRRVAACSNERLRVNGERSMNRGIKDYARTSLLDEVREIPNTLGSECGGVLYDEVYENVHRGRADIAR